MKRCLLLILLLLNSQMNLVKASNDEGNKVATVAAATAVGAAAGYGLYKLFSAFSSSSDSLVDDACKELMKAKKYSEQLEILEKEMKGLSSIDKKELIFSVDEDLADQLIESSSKKIIDQSYLSELRQNIKNLKYYQNKFPKRIRKLEKYKDKSKYLSVINDMDELVKRIDILLPKLDLLNQYIENHIKYFELDESMKIISSKFNSELEIVAPKRIFVDELKRKIRSKYRSSTYPLIDYVNKIESEILKFDKLISRAISYEELVLDAKDLKKKILKIKDIISSDNDYFAEKRALEKEKEQSALSTGMFFLGAAAGAVTGAALASKPKNEIVIVEKKHNNDSYVIEMDDEIIIAQ